MSEILEIEARALAAEESAAFERYWQIRDKLAGYARVEPAKLGDIGEDIAKGLNRQKRLARENLLLLETSGWMDFLDKIATGSEKAWRDYGQRLAVDASARFMESRQ